MADNEGSGNNSYDQARQAFNELNLEDRLFFIVRETVNTAAQALECAFDSLRKEFDATFDSKPQEETPPETTTETETA